MIQNTASKCNKHQKLLISFQKAKSSQESGYCSDCFFDNSKKYNCQQMHLTIIGIVQNELFEIQQKMNQMNNNVTQSIEQLHDNVQLIGQMKDGKKHGDYYYLFDDGTKEYAGIFEQNKKEGIWQDFVSFTYEVENYFQRQNKKKRMKTSIYNQGNKLTYQQITGQIYMEKFGLFNQLLFQGKLVNNQKMGQWDIIYKYEICGGGYYDENGNKFELWTEVCQKYNNIFNVTYQGEYKNGIRIGKWKTSQKGKEIGGGQYDKQGVKSGQWIDLHDNYCDPNKVTYYGEYKNGLKIGKWKTLDQSKEIGGGLYDENGVKSGQWIDIHDNYRSACLVTYQGVYKNGLRIEKWKTLYRNRKIGGGQYDENGLKSGQWIDLNEYRHKVQFPKSELLKQLIMKYLSLDQ